MAAPSCDLYPDVNGEPSKLYQDLLKLAHNDRKLVNYVYAAYLQQGVAAQMDQSNYPRNGQNQHNAKDVFKFLNVDKLLISTADSEYIAMKRAGSIDSDGNKIIYNDGKQALERADVFNNSSLGESFVASVFQHGDEFQIFVERKDSKSVENVGLVKEQLKAWEMLTQAFNGAGVDLDELIKIYPKIFSPTNIPNMVDWLDNVQKMSPSDIVNLSELDLKLLLTINKNNSLIQRLITRYTDIDNLAHTLYAYLRRSSHSTLSPADAARFQQLKVTLLSMAGINISTLRASLNSMGQNLRTTEASFLISETIKSLGDKVNPNIITDIGRQNKRITSLSKAAERAVQVLARKLDEAYNQKNAKEVIELKKKLSKLIDNIDGKCYYGGTLELIQNVNSDVNTLLTTLNNPSGNTRMEKILEMANNFKALNDIVENYTDILQALSDLNKIIINDNISQADEQSLQNEAKQALKRLKEVKEILDGSKTQLAVDIMTEYLGDTDVNGIPIAILATSATQDSSILDILVSGTDLSNKFAQTIGTIIKRAQQERDKKLLDIKDRIQRATNRLYKAGIKNEDWMYDKDGRIISDIDWGMYYKRRAAYMWSLRAQGIKGYMFDKMLQDWEEQNTEDRVVDVVSKRTERVPKFKKSFPLLNSAQKEYYDTMMQLKGELGTLLPEYAREQFTPPQIRLNFIDAINRARKEYKGTSRVKRIFKVCMDSFKDMFIWREDDTIVDKTGYYHGEYSGGKSNPDGSLKKRIPIFYYGKLKDPSMLDKNFSRAISLMATTAVNYNSMKTIESTAQYMKDFTNGTPIMEIDDQGNEIVNITENKSTLVVERIKKATRECRLPGLIEGLIDSKIYGRQAFRKTWLNKMWLNLQKFTSWAALTLNLKGAVVNETVGHIQTFIEGMGGEFFSFSDWLKAEAETMDPTRIGGRMADIVNGTKLSIDTLLEERFNIKQDNFSKMKELSYRSSSLGRIYDSVDSMILYGIGEYHIHQINFRAILNSEKVLLNGRKVPLKEIFDKTAPVDGVCKLIIKPGATRLDGSPITEEYLDSIMNIVKLVNQEHHGAMNDEDKGIICRHIWGKSIMHFRQWMVKHYYRRYGKAHKDPLTGLVREGFYRTTLNMMAAQILEFKAIRKLIVKISNSTDFADKLEDFKGMYLYKNMKARNDKTRIANLRKASTEIALALALQCLFGLVKGWTEGDDDDDDWMGWSNLQILSIIDRLLVDVIGSTPIGIFGQSQKLINKPIPSVNTINKIMYPISNIEDITKEYEVGRFKGQNKWWHNVKYEFLPFTKQIDDLLYPADHKYDLHK